MYSKRNFWKSIPSPFPGPHPPSFKTFYLVRTVKNRVLLGCLCALGCETLFGLSYVFTRQVTADVSMLSLLGWRFCVAALVMGLCVLMGVLDVRLSGKPKAPLIGVALFSPVAYFICETAGISYTSASESGVFLSCIPVASLTASALILRKKPSRRQMLGIAVTVLGVALTVLSVGVSASVSVTGYVFLLLAVLSYALYSVFVEKASEYSGAELTFVMMLFGAAAFVPMALIEAGIEGHVAELLCLPFCDAGFLGTVLYLGIGCSVLAFFLSNVAIASIGVNRSASFIGVSTVVSVLAGVFFLGEAFTFWQAAGTAVILTGVTIANTERAAS